MNTNYQQRPLPWRDDQGRFVVVSLPRPDEGLRNALHGSFAMVPAIPAEFVRLLERLH